jgi:hypothetical protein
MTTVEHGSGDLFDSEETGRETDDAPEGRVAFDPSNE